jgi:hypothetical protein
MIKEIDQIFGYVGVVANTRPLTPLDYGVLLASSLFGIGLGVYYLVAPVQVFQDSARKSLQILRSAWHRWFIRAVCLPFVIAPTVIALRIDPKTGGVSALLMLIPMFGFGLFGLLAAKFLQEALYRGAERNMKSRWFPLQRRIGGIIAILAGISGPLLLIIVPLVSKLMAPR